MNAWRQFLRNQGATPGKLALIGVLAVIMFVVIWVQLPSAEPGAVEARSSAEAMNEPPAPMPAAAKGGETLAEAPANSTKPTELPRKAWPEFSIQSLLRCDPFAHQAWSRPIPKKDSPATEVVADKKIAPPPLHATNPLGELKQKGVSLVLLANGQKVARVGGQQFRVGDTINGYRIMDIAKDGMVLEEERQ